MDLRSLRKLDEILTDYYQAEQHFTCVDQVDFFRSYFKDCEQVEPCVHLYPIWYKLAMQNPWICDAVDPPFSMDSFQPCYSVEELALWMRHANWCLGEAFVLGDLCFINQIDGGDEWLTIKQDLAFESASLGLMLKSHCFYDWIESVQKATLEQCRNLEYGGKY